MRLFLALMVSRGALGQQVGPAYADPMMMIDMKPGDTHLTRASVQAEGRFGRWLTLDTASVMTRYRFVESFAGSTVSNQQQHQIALAGDLHLDAAGRIGVHAGLYSGNSFLGGWDATGPGTGSAQSNLYLKQLFVRVKPWSGWEVQYGGLGFARGESSEITSYDADGFLVGERIVLRRPKQVFFDEVSATYGHLGDLGRASVFGRLGRLNRSNYHQFLVTKRAGRHVRVSADYSSESGQGTFRQAITWTKRFRVANLLRFEQYERDGPAKGYGFSGYAEKRWHRLTVGSGYASHDRRGLYADRFSAGRYVFGNVHCALNSAWSISTQVTQGVTSPLMTAPRTRIDVAVGYNLRPVLSGAGWF